MMRSLTWMCRYAVAGVLMLGASGVSVAVGPCVASPAAAVRSFEAGQVADGGAGEGYRVTRVRRDAVLGTRWAMVERCGHPEWPGVMVPTTSEVEVARTVASAGVGGGRIERVVRPGETVRLWRHETNVRMEMAAVSEESGAAGGSDSDAGGGAWGARRQCSVCVWAGSWTGGCGDGTVMSEETVVEV